MVEVVSAQVSVARSRFYFENAIAHFKNGHVECTAAQVEYENRFVGLFCPDRKPALQLSAR